MKTIKFFEVHYWQGGATIKGKLIKAKNMEQAKNKFFRYTSGELLSIEEMGAKEESE